MLLGLGRGVSKLLVTTVGRENICFIYLTRPLCQRYNLTMRIYFLILSIKCMCYNFGFHWASDNCGKMWDKSDQLPFLIGCNLDFALLSMYCLAVECKKLCMKLALGFLDSSAQGVGCRQCLGDARSSFCAIAAALISLVSRMCFFNQFWNPSAFTNQGLQNLSVILVSYGSGSVHTRAVFFQWGKLLM